MLIVEWDGDDLWNLLNLPNMELYRLYGKYYKGNNQHRRETLRRIANTKRSYYRQGKIAMPERDTPYDPNQEPLNVEQRRSRLAKNLAGKALEVTTITVPVEHLAHHEKLEEALQQGPVNKATFTAGEHTGYIKNAENEIEYTQPLKSNQVRFSVEFDTEPKWVPVNRVESVKLPKREINEKDRLRTAKRAIVLSDLQIPYQSPEAVDVALQIVQDSKPDQIILVGDMLDLSAWGKYLQRPEFAQQTQEAINQAHHLLATLRKMCPTADISVLEGNHSARLEKHVLTNAQAAYGLRRADKPEGWPVLSVPYLCAFDQLDVEWVPGYPANRKWVNENLQVRHGHLARKGNTAILVAQEERVSTIFGHIHRLESQFLSHHTYEGGKTIGAFSIGCLCKIDGSVPSTKNGYDLRGNPVPNTENWQNAICYVDYEEGNGTFNVQPIYINSFQNHRAVFNGRIYEPRPSQTA